MRNDCRPEVQPHAIFGGDSHQPRAGTACKVAHQDLILTASFYRPRRELSADSVCQFPCFFICRWFANRQLQNQALYFEERRGVKSEDVIREGYLRGDFGYVTVRVGSGHGGVFM